MQDSNAQVMVSAQHTFICSSSIEVVRPDGLDKGGSSGRHGFGFGLGFPVAHRVGLAPDSHGSGDLAL